MKRPSTLRTAGWIESVTALFDSPSWSKEQFRGFQSRALCRLVQHAYDSVPYYRRLFDREGLKPGDIRGIGDLGLIPVTQRDHLQSLPAQEVVAHGYNHRNLVVRRTSGSTGAPASIRRTQPEEWLLQALRLRANTYYGGRLTSRRALIQFRRGDDSCEDSAPPRPAYMKWGLLPAEVVHCLLPPDELISRLRSISPDVISGYPGTISWIAGHMNAADRACIRPRYVTIGGETVTPEMRRQIETVFRVPAISHYGSHEFNLIATECRRAGQYHLCEDNVLGEVLRDGRPAAAGDEGKFVGTALHSYAMPLIRYRLGDTVIRGGDCCPCGASCSTLLGIQGRMLDRFLLPNGESIHPYSLVFRLLQHAPWIRRYQITQVALDRVQVQLVPLEEPDPDKAVRIERVLAEGLGQGIHVEVTLVAEIPPRTQWKIPALSVLCHLLASRGEREPRPSIGRTRTGGIVNPAAVSVLHPLADLFRAKSIVWQTLLGSYCAGLHLLCPMKIVACSDHGKEFEQLERQGLRFLSQEQATRGRILVHDATIEGMTTLVSANLEAKIRRHPGEDWTLVCPYPCRSLENLGRDRGWTVITQPWRRAEWLADKHNFFDGLDQIGLPRMPGRWVRWPEARYSELTTEIGPRFVAQLSRGSSGSGTFFIGSRDDYTAAGARFGREPVWVAPNLGPLALNINAVALSRSAVASCPSVQLVGLERLGANPGGYAGNDFSAVSELPAAAIRDVQEQTERIGSWIASLGYRGLFGLDFVIDRESGTNYAVDLNPRWQGSTALEVQAQLRAGRMPLAAADLAWRLGLLGEADVARHRDDFRMPVRGSQLILRSRMSGDSKVTRGVAAGVYEMSPTLNYSGEGVMLGDCRSPGQLLVTGGVPLRDTVLAPGAFVARIVSERAAVSFTTMDLQTMDLRRWAQDAARELYDALGIEAV